MTARTIARVRSWPFAFGVLAAAAGLVLLALFDPVSAARGWLAGWFLALSVAVGSTMLLLIHALAGGGWRTAGEPWLSLAARASPLLALGGVVVFAARGSLYPWIGAGGLAGGVGTIWLDGNLWTLRLAAVLVVWGVLGRIAGQEPGRGAAAWGLIAWGVTISVAGVDWLLSLDPHYVSTDFAALIAIQQLGCALALPAVAGLSPGSGRARSDWGGLLLATLLGTVYLAGMQFLVSWSGDLPEKAAWYLARNRGAGLLLAWGIVLFGVLAPFLVLLPTAWRGAGAALRVAGGLALLGAGAHLVWIVTPLSTASALPALPAAMLTAWFWASIARLIGPAGVTP